MKHTTGQQLFKYAWIYRKTLLIALVFLAIAVCAELAGPLIAKKMIDTNILGIEKVWYETTSTNGEFTVSYQNKYYVREDHRTVLDLESISPPRPVRILQVDRQFVFLDRQLDFEGELTLEDSVLTVRKGKQLASYPVNVLSSSEVYSFYRPESRSLLVSAEVYLVLLIFASLFTFVQRYLLQKTANRIIQRMRNDVFEHLQKLPIAYFDNYSAGKIVSRVTNDTEAVRDLYVAVLSKFFSGIIYVPAIIGAIFLLDYRLALLALPLIPMLYAWVILYRRYATRYNQELRSRISDLNGMISESIQGMPIIQAFGQQKKTVKEFSDINDQYFSYQKKLLKLNTFTSSNLLNVIRNIIFLSVILLFGGGWVDTFITIGVLYAFIDYMNRLFQPIVGIVNQLPSLETAIVSASRVFELMQQPGTDVVEDSIPRYRGNFSFEHVSFAYNDDKYVLQDVSFEVQQGETVAIIGHTGSGKSTIFNLLFRFYEVNKGKILVDGQDLRDIPHQYLREHMGIVLQDPFLFTGTICSNVSLNNPNITREQVEKALRDVGAYDMFAAFPNGIDEPVIEKGATLSAGQKQLISFARVLAFNPAILILDEATANIDTETEAIIQEALDVLKQGRTTLIIAHRLSTIRNADQILVLDRGQIVERGTHKQLVELQGKYSQMYELQIGERSAQMTV